MIDDVPHTIVFTSLAVLEDSVKAAHKYLSMHGRDLLQLVRGSHLILNPGSECAKQLLPAEIEAILDGSAGRGYATKVIEKETTVELGQPAVFPTHVADTLRSVFRSRRRVRAAYLALCAWPESGERHLIVGIDTTDDWERLMQDLSSALRTSTQPDEIIDFVRMDGASPLADYMRSTRPIYKRKILGLF